MYTYPFTEQGISDALKETYDSDSPVIPGSFCMIRSKGDLIGGNCEATYTIQTEDGCKYEIAAKGLQILVPYVFRLEMRQITGVKKV